MKFSFFNGVKKNDADVFFNRLRKKEYSRLDTLGHVYLDYTGGSIYPESLLKQHYRFLQKAVYGNPHSNNPTSMLSEKFVSEARKKVVDFFNASDYYCVFTHNASGALQIVGECYPFSPESHYLLTTDNHNSVNGIREYCKSKGGGVTYTPMRVDDLSIDETELTEHLHAHPGKRNKLFAFPAQSNVSGVQHSLALIAKAQEQGWDVLLDAAAFVPSSRLDLSVVRPDFVSLSFYKIFGYPTGIGCLLIKKSKFNKLKKRWFAGGTITLSAVKHNGYFLKQDHEKFEDGTVNYLDIPAITNGLDFINAIGIEKIHQRVTALCGFFLEQIAMLRHNNDLPLIKLYGPKNTLNRGGTFLLNFYDEFGRPCPFQFIEEEANANKISLRTGCFCNPGIDEMNHCLSEDQLKSYFVGRKHGDYYDIINFLKKIRGAVRVSVGLATTKADIEKFIKFAKKFLNQTVPQDALMAFDKADLPALNFKEGNVKLNNIKVASL